MVEQVADPCRRVLTIPSRTDKLALVREMIRRTIQEGGFPADNPTMLVLAVDEAVSNIIEHGYRDLGEGEVLIEVLADVRRLEVRVQDWGRVFNPTLVPELDIAKHVQAGSKRGLGIFLIRKIMDEVCYSFPAGGGNRLIMVKHARSQPAHG